MREECAGRVRIKGQRMKEEKRLGISMKSCEEREREGMGVMDDEGKRDAR